MHDIYWTNQFLVCWGKMIIDWFSLIQRDCWASEEVCARLKLVYQSAKLSVTFSIMRNRSISVVGMSWKNKTYRTSLQKEQKKKKTRSYTHAAQTDEPHHLPAPRLRSVTTEYNLFHLIHPFLGQLYKIISCTLQMLWCMSGKTALSVSWRSFMKARSKYLRK